MLVDLKGIFMRSHRLLFWGCLFLSATVRIAVSSEMFSVPVMEQPDLSKLKPMPVVKVASNNTITVIQDGNEITVQLIGVDVPAAARLVNCAEQTSQFLNNLLKGESVYIVSDPKCNSADANSSIAAYIYRAPDGLFVNAEIIRQGYGLVAVKNMFRYINAFHQLELFSRQAGKGIWGAESAVLPVERDEQESKAVPIAAAVVEDDSKPKELNDNDIIVYVTKSGRKYHKEGCRFLSKSSMPIKFKEAKEKYSPCKVCNPPQ